ncbi:DNA polymerase III subunit chi [Neptuniibacter sp.]|uniref:DNA polymerase III subunit chi n=1 Tax=Neptuniibacter sp. TaxID=1962643 RepID=UPI00261201AA|nr:DNA polymerase III subunit chi [Neptuniibacter sp.]MCP4597521.1 DNA polymerase III subunit chi [Neptuniibacter sp.]
MTSKADFYVLPSNDPDARGRFLCRLVTKIRALGHELYIQTANESEAKRIDQLLWEFQPEAFIPHELLGDKLNSGVQIGWDTQRPEHKDVFVNLNLDIPKDALEFDRILEIVIQSEEVLASTRNNYKSYQANGISIDMHDMRKR